MGTRADDRPRSEFVGASDAAAAVGLNPWVSRFDLWARKTGRISESTIEERPAVRAGIALEPVVREQLRLYHDQVHLVRDPEKDEFWLHENELVGAHPDGGIEMTHPTLELPGEGVLEVKNVGSYVFDQIQEEGLPASHVLQIQQTMGLMEAPWGAFAIHGREAWQTLLFPMGPDQKIIDYLIEQGAKFMRDHVQADVAPEMFPDETIPDIPILGRSLVHVEGDETWEDLMEEYRLYRDASKAVKEVWEDGKPDDEGDFEVGLKSRLKAKMVELDTEIAVGAGWKIIYKPDTKQRQFERNMLTEMAPFVPDDVQEVLGELMGGEEAAAVWAELSLRTRLAGDDERLFRKVPRPYGPQGFAQKED